VSGRLRRFPEYRVTLIILSGYVKDDETVELLRTLDERDRDCRITYFSEDAELGGVIADTPRIKRTLAEKQRELPGGRHAFVCPSTASREYADFLKRYSAAGDVHPKIPRVFSSLEAACGWLGLPDGACEALAEAANRATLEARGRQDNAHAKGAGSPDQASH
jgi:hypothetical protein